MENNKNITWSETIKKEARGIDDADFGEIQSVDSEYVITQKGIIDKEFFSFPINLVQYYDGNAVIFKVTEEEARKSYMQSKDIDDASNSGVLETETATTDESLSNKTKKEEIIPLMSEELDIIKRVVVDETSITKKPLKETKTVEIQLVREIVESIQRRPPTYKTEGEAQEPIQSPKEIKISLKREEPEVTKKPYVKEEVVIKKKIVTDNKKITEEITSEEIDTHQI